MTSKLYDVSIKETNREQINDNETDGKSSLIVETTEAKSSSQQS